MNWNTAAFNVAPGVTLVRHTCARHRSLNLDLHTATTGKNDLEYTEAHLAGDYAIVFDMAFVKSTTLAGFAANTLPKGRGSRAAAFKLRLGAPSAWNGCGLVLRLFPGDSARGFPPPASATHPKAKQDDLQFFGYENVTSPKNLIQLSGGVSRYFGTLTRTHTTGTGINPLFPNSPASPFTSNATSLIGFNDDT